MGGIDLTVTPLPTVNSLGQGVPRGADEKTALRSFESYVLGEMLKRAMPEPSAEGLFDGGQAGRMYREHLYQEYARMISEVGDFGLAKQLEGRLSPSSEGPGNGAEERPPAGEEVEGR